MNKYNYLLMAILLASIAVAQNIPTIGATWCYWQEHSSGNPYLATANRIVAEKDTVINGDSYYKLCEYSINKIGQESFARFYLLHDSSGYVYYLRNAEKGLLFNFNAQVGDSVTVDLYLADNYPLMKEKVKVTNIVTDSFGLKTYIFNENAQLTQRILNKGYHGNFLALNVIPTIPEGGAYLRAYKDSSIVVGDTSQPCLVSPYIPFLGSNAQWYYSLWRTNEQTGGYFYRILASGDTLLSGKNCKVIRMFDSYGQLIDGAYYYMYEEARKGYIWQHTQFKLLYDFSAQVGDTITAAVVYHPQLRVFETHDVPTNTEVSYVVKNIRVVGQRTYWDVQYLDSSWRFSDAIMEGIGSWLGIFGGPYHAAPTGLAGSLRCYFNGTHGINYGNFSQCDKILSVNELVSQQHFRLYPNPTNDIIQLPESLIRQEYEVYTTLGKIILSGSVSESATVSLSQLPPGTYFIRLPQTQQHAVVLKE